MTDEDAFLRAIHAAPNDNLPKLVYADWLDERGQQEKAAYIRHTIAGRQAWQSPNAHLSGAWMDLYSGNAHLWDAPTMLALGRLQGLLDGLAAGNNHSANVSFYFSAVLVPFDGNVSKLLARFYRPFEPTLVLLDDWRTTLRLELARWIGMEQGTIHPAIGRAHQTPEGCGWTADRVL